MRALVTALSLILLSSPVAQAVVDDPGADPCARASPSWGALGCTDFSCVTLNGNVFDMPGYISVFLGNPIGDGPVSLSLSGCRKIIEPVEDLVWGILRHYADLSVFAAET